MEITSRKDININIFLIYYNLSCILYFFNYRNKMFYFLIISRLNWSSDVTNKLFYIIAF